MRVLTRALHSGKQVLGEVMLEMGRLVAESIMRIEREEVTGPDYYPTDTDLQKVSSRGGVDLYRRPEGQGETPAVQPPLDCGPAQPTFSRGGQCRRFLRKYHLPFRAPLAHGLLANIIVVSDP